jgi:uncharacterized membrane protein
MDSVIAVTFADDAKAYEALTELKTLDGQGQIELTEAAVVVRNEDGKLDTKDEVGGHQVSATATGGLVGLIVGILGGPFGVLLGGATGLLIGSLFDEHDEGATESALEQISRSAEVGHPALLAQVAEQSPEVLDSALGALGGTVVRQSLDDVEAEIAAAKEAQKAARRAAREQLIQQRRAQVKEQIHAKVEELKAKMHPHAVAAGSD